MITLEIIELRAYPVKWDIEKFEIEYDDYDPNEGPVIVYEGKVQITTSEHINVYWEPHIPSVITSIERIENIPYYINEISQVIFKLENGLIQFAPIESPYDWSPLDGNPVRPDPNEGLIIKIVKRS